MLGFRLERFLGTTDAEPPNAADVKRIATVQAFGAAWPRTEHLDTRTRALVAIALNNGVTKEEIVEAFVQVSAYAGAARAFEGYGIAAEVFGEWT